MSANNGIKLLTGLTNARYDEARKSCAVSTAEHNAKRNGLSTVDWDTLHSSRQRAMEAFDAAARALAKSTPVIVRTSIRELVAGDVIVDGWEGRSHLCVVAAVKAQAKQDKRGWWWKIETLTDFPAGCDTDVFSWSRLLRPETLVDIVRRPIHHTGETA